MIASDPHLTSLDLDRLELGGVEPDGRERIAGHVARCSACAARQAEHRELQRQFRTTVFPRTAGSLAAHRSRGLRRAFAPGQAWALALAVVAPLGAGMVLVARVARHAESDSAPSIGVKGDPPLHVFVRRGGGAAGVSVPVARLADGARLSPGDALRFVLDPTGLRYAIIASVDGAGQTSIYFPFHGAASAPVEGRAALAVPNSIVLDRAPGPERLFVIYSDRPVDARTVREALAPAASGGASAIRATRRLSIPGTVQSTLLFEKDGAP